MVNSMTNGESAIRPTRAQTVPVNDAMHALPGPRYERRSRAGTNHAVCLCTLRSALRPALSNAGAVIWQPGSFSSSFAAIAMRKPAFIWGTNKCGLLSSPVAKAPPWNNHPHQFVPAWPRQGAWCKTLSCNSLSCRFSGRCRPMVACQGRRERPSEKRRFEVTKD